MKNTIWAIMTILLISCSAPRKILESKELTAKCHCEGIGKYTIVMDAGMGNWSLFYQPIFQMLKQETRVCIINRAGYAMDSVSLNTRDAKTIAFEIEDALKHQGVDDNIIMVGHSLGGLHVRMYQSIFPNKVKAIILLESAHPDQFNQLPRAFYDLQKQQSASLDKVIKLAQKDYLKYSKGSIPTFGIPDHLLADYYKVTTQPEYYRTMKMESVEFENNLTIVGALNDLGVLPLLVIGSRKSLDSSILPGKLNEYPFEEHNRKWFELQKELAKLSDNSTFVASNHNHYLYITDNEFVTKQIILFINKNFEIQ